MGVFVTDEEKKKKIRRLKRKAAAETRRNMESLGNYKEEFAPMVEKYADMLAQYSLSWEEFIESGCKSECPTKAGGVRKTAAVTTMEELRRQIGAYADRLCLTPKTNNVVEVKERKSAIDSVLEEITKLSNSV